MHRGSTVISETGGTQNGRIVRFNIDFKFRRVLNAVLCLLGILPASELSVPTELLVSSETSALKTQTPGDYPKYTVRQLFLQLSAVALFLVKSRTLRNAMNFIG